MEEKKDYIKIFIELDAEIKKNEKILFFPC
jgi:hypothetical protein